MKYLPKAVLNLNNLTEYFYPTTVFGPNSLRQICSIISRQPSSISTQQQQLLVMLVQQRRGESASDGVDAISKMLRVKVNKSSSILFCLSEGRKPFVILIKARPLQYRSDEDIN